MSLYRMLRMTAIVALLRRYRSRLAHIAFAVAFALVSAWLYADIAGYLAGQAPQWLLAALIAKTMIVYGALFYCCWQISRMISGAGDEPAALAGTDPGRTEPAPSKPLDQLAEKPKLRSRRDELLK